MEVVEITNKVINKIIKELDGTHEILDDLISEYVDEGYDSEDLMEEIMNSLIECQSCGVWVSIKKEINGYCRSCNKHIISYGEHDD